MGIDSLRELNIALLDSLIAGRDMGQTAQTVYLASGIRTAFFDLNYRLLTHTFGEAADKAWAFSLENGHLPSSVIGRNTKMGRRIAEMFATGQPAFFDAGEIGESRFLCLPIYIKGKTGGMLAASFNDRDDPRLVQDIAEALARLYGYFAGGEEWGAEYCGDVLTDDFARELLLYDGDLSKNLLEGLYSVSASDLPGRFEPGYAVAALGGFDGENRLKEMEEAERDLRAFVPRSFHLISDGVLLVFLYNMGGGLGGGIDADILAQLEGIARRYRFRCGISSKFELLAQRKGFRLQAAQALERGKSGEGYVFSASSMYTQIILSGALDRLGKQILELSDVVTLFEYDKRNQTSYLSTLEQYLLHGNKLSRAASSMFVDRSTMKYRLRKIKSMIQQDFENPDAAKRLLMGIAVFKAG
ncbi:MAG: helix-turn-helix domain-containing protein [Peptococcaceae bacterium]|jgi:hypothetical protein|nr:helix-turn-helix domain-containing protein [Peptococcaceae bacterium]